MIYSLLLGVLLILLIAFREDAMRQSNGIARAAVMAAAVAMLFLVSSVDTVRANGYGKCAGLPSWGQLRSALKSVVMTGNGGLEFNMWGTVVNRDGVVCAVAFSGDKRDDQWPGSRVISAQKANTANSFSLKGLALSTGNLYGTVQPGGSLFGLQLSNPVDPRVAYGPNPARYGQKNDPMVGKIVGGVNVFGGGLALYNESGKIVGALGVSGDTSCSDHVIGWRVRDVLGLDFVPGGVSATSDDNLNINADPASDATANKFEHPTCGGDVETIISNLPTDYPIGALTN